MKKIIVSLVLTLAGLASAQDVGLYNRALSAFNAGSFDESARGFYELSENSTDPEIRAKSEYYLAQSLARKNLPFAAVIYDRAIMAQGQEHPFYLKAVEGMINGQRDLNDQYIVPSILDRELNDSWVTLPLEVLGRINYLVGVISHRKAKFEEARDFLTSVDPTTAVYAKAQYLLGVVYADPRYPGGAKPEEAIKAFETVLGLKGDHYEDLVDTQQLATLGIARTYYGEAEFAKAVQYYERIPRFSKYWDVALFENGWARFQNDDRGGALGSLQALHAPQFAGAFQPESWIVKATVYYFSCLYEESGAALKSFDETYRPMKDQLEKVLEGEDKDLTYFYKLIADENTKEVPRPVLLWARGNERMLSVFGLISELEREKAAISANTAWQGSKLGPDLIDRLNNLKGTLTTTAGQLAKNRLVEALQDVKSMSDQAEIIRFELSKAEKELYESGVDQKKILDAQNLYRPAMPAENWNYWKFQGEFWIDEIGYYQYTLKQGCPATEQPVAAKSE
ncbi:MAG: tetratricopeptide repeat protein [Myxococcaceae bacterium]|nr:tetratricopeptide repeat protein [Myxococcaceae bacterium]